MNQLICASLFYTHYWYDGFVESTGINKRLPSQYYLSCESERNKVHDDRSSQLSVGRGKMLTAGIADDAYIIPDKEKIMIGKNRALLVLCDVDEIILIYIARS